MKEWYALYDLFYSYGALFHLIHQWNNVIPNNSKNILVRYISDGTFPMSAIKGTDIEWWMTKIKEVSSDKFGCDAGN